MSCLVFICLFYNVGSNMYCISLFYNVRSSVYKSIPKAEGTSSGLLNASAQIFGIICTMFGEWMFRLDSLDLHNLVSALLPN